MKSYKIIYKKKAEKFIMTNKIEGLKFFKAFQEVKKIIKNMILKSFIVIMNILFV